MANSSAAMFLVTPFPGHLKGPLVQGTASKLLLDPSEKEEIHRSQVRQLRRMFKLLDIVGGKPQLSYFPEHWPDGTTTPVQPHRPLFLQLLQKVPGPWRCIFCWQQNPWGRCCCTLGLYSQKTPTASAWSCCNGPLPTQGLADNAWIAFWSQGCGYTSSSCPWSQNYPTLPWTGAGWQRWRHCRSRLALLTVLNSKASGPIWRTPFQVPNPCKGCCEWNKQIPYG